MVFKILYEVLIPHNHICVAIQIAIGELMLVRSFALGAKHDYVVKMLELLHIDSL
jgi:hypothetical protein